MRGDGIFLLKANEGPCLSRSIEIKSQRHKQKVYRKDLPRCCRKSTQDCGSTSPVYGGPASFSFVDILWQLLYLMPKLVSMATLGMSSGTRDGFKGVKEGSL